jgi:hypothetical protein
VGLTKKVEVCAEFDPKVLRSKTPACRRCKQTRRVALIRVAVTKSKKVVLM